MAQNFSIDDQLKKAKNFANKGNFLEAKKSYQKILKIFPKKLRDYVYKVLSKNRYLFN